MRHHILVEAIDERVFIHARIGAKSLGAVYQNLVGIRAKDSHRFRDELVKRHG